MNADAQHDGRRTAHQVWGLTGLGLMTGLVTLVILGLVLARLDGARQSLERSRVTLADFVERSQSIVDAGRRDIEALLDADIDASDPAWLHELQTLEPPVALQSADGGIAEHHLALEAVRRDARVWAGASTRAAAAMQAARADVDAVLDEMRATEALDAGRKALAQALLIRRIESAERDEVEAAARELAAKTRSNADHSTLHTELADLAVLCQKIATAETDADLVDLQQNRVAPALSRLRRVSMRSPEALPSELLDRLEDALLGQGFVRDVDQQTIDFGDGGLFLARGEHIASIASRTRITARSDHEFAMIGEEQGLMRDRSSERFHELTLQAKDDLKRGIRSVILVGLIAAIGFLVLASRIARGIGRHVRSLGAANVALVEASAAADRASRAKSDFLANMSHEIRTPMTAIIGFSDVLAEHSSRETREAIETIQRNGRHLLSLINDILDLSKLEAGKLDVEWIELDPIEVARDVIALMDVRASGKGLALVLENEGAVPSRITGDPTRLRQILVNLIGNAIKFTESGSVRVITRLVAGRASAPAFLQFDIVDTGMGMTEEQCSRLFQPFEQADNSMARRFGGSGLGLAITRRLLMLMDGDVAVRSEPGRGSTFSVTVPTGSLEGVAMIDDIAAHVVAADEAPAGAQAAPETAKSAEKRPLAGRRVLLAEDGPDNQRLIGFHLKRNGADATIVENGRLAMDAALDAVAAGKPFDLILMDMQMPEMSGYEATANLRERGYAGPIIALTAHAMSGDREKCIAAGCDDYLTKPLDVPSLLAAVDALDDTEHRRAA